MAATALRLREDLLIPRFGATEVEKVARTDHEEQAAGHGSQLLR
jgi:hypothetical protein